MKAAGLTPKGADGQTDRATQAAGVRWQERRIALKHRLGDVVEKGIERAAHEVEHGSARDAKDAMTAAAIALDKAEVLSVHDDPEELAADAEAIEAKVVKVRGRGMVLLPGGLADEGAA